MSSKVFPARKDALDTVISFVEEELEKIDCPMKAVMQISVCTEEMFINVASYAYTHKEGSVALSVDAEPGAVSVTLTDSGVPFDPLSAKTPDITLSAEERKVGGLGIYMVKQSMDHVAYQRKDGKNIFTMTKKI